MGHNISTATSVARTAVLPDAALGATNSGVPGATSVVESTAVSTIAPHQDASNAPANTSTESQACCLSRFICAMARWVIFVATLGLCNLFPKEQTANEAEGSQSPTPQLPADNTSVPPSTTVAGASTVAATVTNANRVATDSAVSGATSAPQPPTSRASAQPQPVVSTDSADASANAVAVDAGTNADATASQSNISVPPAVAATDSASSGAVAGSVPADQPVDTTTNTSGGSDDGAESSQSGTGVPSTAVVPEGASGEAVASSATAGQPVDTNTNVSGGSDDAQSSQPGTGIPPAAVASEDASGEAVASSATADQPVDTNTNASGGSDDAQSSQPGTGVPPAAVASEDASGGGIVGATPTESSQPNGNAEPADGNNNTNDATIAVSTDAAAIVPQAAPSGALGSVISALTSPLRAGYNYLFPNTSNNSSADSDAASAPASVASTAPTAVQPGTTAPADLDVVEDDGSAQGAGSAPTGVASVVSQPAMSEDAADATSAQSTGPTGPVSTAEGSDEPELSNADQATVRLIGILSSKNPEDFNTARAFLKEDSESGNLAATLCANPQEALEEGNMLKLSATLCKLLKERKPAGICSNIFTQLKTVGSLKEPTVVQLKRIVQRLNASERAVFEPMVNLVGTLKSANDSNYSKPMEDKCLEALVGITLLSSATDSPNRTARSHAYNALRQIIANRDEVFAA